MSRGSSGQRGIGGIGEAPVFDARRIVALRGEKRPLDPWRPIRLLAERERLPGPAPQEVAPALAVFLAGAECPFRCVFCDLWQETLDGPTPEGAIARQVEVALGILDGASDGLDGGRGTDSRSRGVEIPAPIPAGRLAETVVKLYNASNFFDPRAVPEGDLAEVGRLVAGARRVVVECHPRLILGGRGLELCRSFGFRLRGTLEVAMGLETVHPEAFARLDKGMALDDFARAAEVLLDAGAEVRAFVLVGAPYVSADEAVEWAVSSVEHALAAGARNVALIPVRGGGALDLLAREGRFVPPRLDQLEEALAAALELPAARAGAVVTADLWDLERFSSCSICLPERSRRLERANLRGRLDPVPGCSACGRQAGMGGAPGEDKLRQ